MTLLAARLHDAQHRLPAGDASVSNAIWWLDSAAAMIRERRRDLAAFERSADEVRGSMRSAAMRITDGLD